MSRLELRVPPPAVALVIAALMWLLARALPPLDFHLPARGLLAVAVGLAGVLIGVVAFLQMRRAGTTVNPTRPHDASVLVMTGVYRLSRNPMYVGDVLILAGWSLWLANAAAVVLLLPFVMYINRYQIPAEERALAARFGGTYEEYCRAVRRWL